jgi:hypothetical protein
LTQDIELRQANRTSHKDRILLEHYRTGEYHVAEMRNFSRGGMYFESDFAPLPGTEVYIGIERSPYDAGADLFRAEVRWRNRLSPHQSTYSYGVGVKYRYPITP